MRVLSKPLLKLWGPALFVLSNVLSNVLSKNLAWSSSTTCKWYPDLTEVCFYTNACFAGGQLLLYDPNQSGSLPEPSGGIKNNYHHFRYPYMSVSKPAALPFRSFAAGRYINKYPPTHDAVIHPGTTFLGFFDTQQSNPFHFAQKVMVAHLVENVERVHIDRAWLDRERLSPWESLLTNVLFNETVSLRRTVSQASFQKPSCFERLVIPGTVIWMFLGPELAVRFREKAFARVQVPLPVNCGNPIHITFVNRQASLGRHVLNYEQLLQRVPPGLNVTYVESFDRLNAMEQVRLMSSTRILVATHGAGQTNVIYMRTGGVLIQLFQPHYNYYLYERIAHQSGLRTVFVTGNRAVSSGRDCNVERHALYQNVSSQECLKIHDCMFSFKGCNYDIDPNEFSIALRNAVDMVDQDQDCV